MWENQFMVENQQGHENGHRMNDEIKVPKGILNTEPEEKREIVRSNSGWLDGV